MRITAAGTAQVFHLIPLHGRQPIYIIMFGRHTVSKSIAKLMYNLYTAKKNVSYFVFVCVFAVPTLGGSGAQDGHCLNLQDISAGSWCSS